MAGSSHSFVQAWSTALRHPWPSLLIFATNGIRVYKELMAVSNANSPPPSHNPSSLTTSPRCATTNQYSSNALHAITCSIAEGRRGNAKITSGHGTGRWGGCRSGEREAGNELLRLRSFSAGVGRTGIRREIRLPLYPRRHANLV